MNEKRQGDEREKEREIKRDRAKERREKIKRDTGSRE